MKNMSHHLLDLIPPGLLTLTVLIVSLVIGIPTARSETKEMGFVALSQGKADYEHLGEEQEAVSSFFLVKLFKEYNISLGAIILNSYQQATASWVDKGDPEYDLYEIELDNVRHTAWGTLLAYSVSSESFFGFQAWGGVGYLSNTLKFNGTTVSLYKEVNDDVTLCELTLDGRTGELKSFPVFIGIGFTINGFGLFIQYMEQKTDPLEMSISVSDKCSFVIGEESFSDSYKDSYNTELKSSFKLISTGIQYRF